MTTFLSKEKIKDLKKQLSLLEKRIKTDNAEQLKRGGLADSWHETASHAAAISAVESKVIELQQILKQAKEYPKIINSDIVSIGSWVDLIDNDRNIIKYRIVHPLEADPRKYLISFESHLGKLLLGMNVDTSIKMGNIMYIIKKIY